MNRRSIRSTLQTLFFAGLLIATLSLLASGGTSVWPAAQARETSQTSRAFVSQTIPVISVADLPVQARDMLRRIEQGGPFEGYKNGVIFGNYERLLPSKRRGYYREYTVPTPGARNRGARRIVCGGARRHPDVCYYTHDHYASFRRIAQ